MRHKWTRMLRSSVNHMTLDVFHSRAQEKPVCIRIFFVFVTAAYLGFLECLVSPCILPNIINFIENIEQNKVFRNHG